MKKTISIILITVSFISCKKDYNCECYSERRGFQFLEVTYTVKERNESKALSKCIDQYESSPDYVDGSCRLK